MSYNQISISSSDYVDSKFAKTLEALHKINSSIKVNTFDEVKYTRPTADKCENNV